jgi:hypothetical protein
MRMGSGAVRLVCGTGRTRRGLRLAAVSFDSETTGDMGKISSGDSGRSTNDGWAMGEVSGESIGLGYLGAGDLPLFGDE